jgi:uncharacterized protein YggU (UPF0235/DUF167 family)
LSPSDLLRPAGPGLSRLSVRLTPKAAANRLQGVATDESGALVLRVAVTAVPERGRANQALIALLAKLMKLPKSAFVLESGATDRRKCLLIEGDPAELAERLLREGK